MYHRLQITVFVKKFNSMRKNKEVYDNETKAYRNCNPINIRWSERNRWWGQSGCDDRGFCRFQAFSYGYRAAVMILHKYHRDGWRTVGEIIARWAPSTENDTKAYTDSVCRIMSPRFSEPYVVTPETMVDLKNRELVVHLLYAMSKVETGWNVATLHRLKPYMETGYDLAATKPGFF